LVRGLPKDPKLKDVNLEKYIKFINKIRSYNNRKSHELYINSSLKDKLMSKYIVNSIEQKKFQGMYCLAGDKVGVIYSNGDVFPCELLNKQIGNIKEHNYNFKELWNSEKGKHVRRFIKVTQCFCTHECFLTANLLLNPRNLVRYIKEYIFSMIRSPDVTKKKSEIEHPAKLKAGVN
jgi:radical SAM protein with 4Fe4S-binding SPASM domain